MKIVVVIIDDIKYRKGIEFIEDIVVMTVRTFDFYEFCVLISVNHEADPRIDCNKYACIYSVTLDMTR